MEASFARTGAPTIIPAARPRIPTCLNVIRFLLLKSAVAHRPVQGLCDPARTKSGSNVECRFGPAVLEVRNWARAASCLYVGWRSPDASEAVEVKFRCGVWCAT